jgi:hypothetical protein
MALSLTEARVTIAPMPDTTAIDQDHDRQRCRRTCASSGSKWEPKMGYSRAVRAGNVIAVTGCVGINADGTNPKMMGEQAGAASTSCCRRRRPGGVPRT